MKIDPTNLDKRTLHELAASAIVPRPIAFVSTIGKDGVFNLAPFSFFTPLCLKPFILAFSIGWKRDGQKKDTLKNVEFSKDFVVNAVNESLAKAMNQTSAEYPSNVDEFKEVGLTPINSELVKALYKKIPESELPWRILGYQTDFYQAYYGIGRYQDVIDLATMIINGPGSSQTEDSYYWRALAEEALGKKTSAVLDLKTSLKINPNFDPGITRLDLLSSGD